MHSQVEPKNSLYYNLLVGIRSKLKSLYQSKFHKFNINWWQEKKFKHAPAGKEYCFSYSKNIKINFNDAPAFILSVRELFIDEIYKFRSVSNPFIIDCGAHIGMSLLSYKLQFPNAKIIAFEPDNTNYELAIKNITNWKFGDIKLLKKAIWIHNDEVSFSQMGSMSSSISINSDSKENNEIKITKVSCARLKDYLIQPIDLLKLDIEGAEYEVLKDCSNNLQFVKNMFIEYHGIYSEMHKLNEILNILTENNFKWYVKEAGVIYQRPMYDTIKTGPYDVQLNIFAFR